MFYFWLNDNNIPLSLIFYVDGHKSHIPLSEFCSKYWIILICLFNMRTFLRTSILDHLGTPRKIALEEIISDRELPNKKTDKIRQDISTPSKTKQKQNELITTGLTTWQKWNRSLRIRIIRSNHNPTTKNKVILYRDPDRNNPHIIEVNRLLQS